MSSLGRYALALLACAAGLAAQPAAVVVNGTPLAGGRPPVQQAGDYFLALVPIARQLGATLSFKPERSLHLRRADGTEIDYDGRSGDIRSGIVFVGHVQNYALIQWSGDPDQILFPVSAVVALLSVAVQEDQEHNVLNIDSLDPGAAPHPAQPFSLADLDYTYGVITNARQFGQYANLHGRAVVGNSVYSGLLLLNRVPGRGFIGLNQAALRIDMQGNHALVLGDQASYSGVDAMTNSLRGLSFEKTIGEFAASFYGGLAIGSVSASFGSGSLARYDTVLSGVALRRRRKASEFDLAANLFRNSQRQGVTVGASYSRRAAKNQLNLQLAGGWFNGLSSRTFLTTTTVAASPLTVAPTPASGPASAAPGILDQNGDQVVLADASRSVAVHGPAAGFSASDTMTPISKVTLTGRWDYYTKNFLTARENSQFGAESRRSLSFSVRPLRLITLTAGATDRTFLLGKADSARSYSYGGNVAAPGRFPVQLAFFKSIQLDRASPLGRFSFQQYSLMLPPVRAFSASILYSETLFGKELIRNVNAFAMLDKGRMGQFGLAWTAQLHSNQRFGADWRRSLGKKDAFVRFGLDVSRSQFGTGAGRLTLLPLAGMKLPMPRGQWLQLSYLRDLNSQTLQIELNGPIGRRHELTRDSQGTARMIVFASLAGKVFLDRNYDRRYTSGDDRGISGIRAWLDDEVVVETDGQGNFRFDGLTPGTHRVRIDLAGVPAGLVLAESGERTLAVLPWRANRQDFALIKTVQIRGSVTLLDYSDDPDAPVRRPFPDARIVASGDRDTFSEFDGSFILGELPPQRYTLRLDPATIPVGYVSMPAVITIDAQPGGNLVATFQLVIPPKPSIQVPVEGQRLELSSAGAEKLK